MIPLHLEIVYLAIGIPSLIFYAVVIVALLKKSNKDVFGLPFYRIFAVICVVDCINYVVNTVAFRLPMCPNFAFLYENLKPSFVTRLFHLGVYFCGFFVTFGQCLITINRFSAVAFPLKHHKFWQRYHLHCIGLALLICFAFSGHTLLSTTVFQRFQVDGVVFYTIYMDDMSISVMGKPLQLQLIIACALSCTGVVFQVVLNSTTIILLVRRRKATTRATFNKKLPKTELTLFFLSMAMFLLSLSGALYNIIITLLIYTESDALMGFLDYYLWVADVNNLSAPYLLCLVSASARRTVLEAIGLKAKQNKATVQLFSRTASSTRA
ncbi:hypothetical protein QR680_007932 [Steinernema hermaphroditum]|uniref:Serpentine receptor class gamma n=1 Tax=Steinernema hermaphroditum TaxID=289476 RepID=A0AA39IGX1_9BILA|nr:hypothetical protein QR680_007932 [Steinernema hermaphroditum]